MKCLRERISDELEVSIIYWLDVISTVVIIGIYVVVVL
jgi:hypothetical protein